MGIKLFKVNTDGSIDCNKKVENHTLKDLKQKLIFFDSSMTINPNYWKILMLLQMQCKNGLESDSNPRRYYIMKRGQSEK